MVVAAHAKVIANGGVGISGAVVIGIGDAGELGALHHDEGVVVFGDEAERLVKAGSEESPSFGLEVVKTDFAFMKGDGNFAVGEDVDAADLGVIGVAEWNRFDVEGWVLGGGGESERDEK